MTLDWKSFGADVRRKRTKQDETVRAAAARLGMTSATFSRADRGLSVSAEHFLCVVYDYLRANPRSYVKRHG